MERLLICCKRSWTSTTPIRDGSGPVQKGFARTAPPPKPESEPSRQSEFFELGLLSWEVLRFLSSGAKSAPHGSYVWYGSASSSAGARREAGAGAALNWALRMSSTNWNFQMTEVQFKRTFSWHMQLFFFMSYTTKIVGIRGRTFNGG